MGFSNDLADCVYDVTFKFPKHETYGLGNQLRGAVLSIGANVAEGFGRDDKNDLKRFLRIAYGSLCEVEFFMDFAHRRGYIKKECVEEFKCRSKDLAKLLNSFSKK